MKIEPELDWVEVLFKAIEPFFELSKIEKVKQVFEHGAEKHKALDFFSARIHLNHACVHESTPGIEDESGLPHWAHVAARCLLAFGETLDSEEHEIAPAGVEESEG